jgi:hypothetical protein
MRIARLNGRMIPDLRITQRIRVGWMRYGNCWRFRFSRNRYSTVTYWHFWRLFVAVEK